CAKDWSASAHDGLDFW
nr:immunoglobulin heavy chain junction region [Macaca mulatta]